MSNDRLAPVNEPGPIRTIEEGIAVCLSGGCYRATLFHAGVLWRLIELNLLSPQPHSIIREGVSRSVGTLRRISSVSGGSICSAVLGLKWPTLRFGTPNLVSDYQQAVIEPLRAMTRVTVAGTSRAGILKILKDIVWPGSVSEHVTKDFDKHLFKGATLKSIPAEPRFVINASNLQSGALWRFMNPYMRDWRVGENKNTKSVSLAKAVAASAAFPPFLAPATFDFDADDFTPHSGDGLQRPPFTQRVELGDGGIYDNLGIETAYKRYRTLLVSNAGAALKPEQEIAHDWVRLSKRVIDVVDTQVASLRKRLLMEAFRRRDRFGAFWDIGQDIAIYTASNMLHCPIASTQALACLETDLDKKDDRTQERLINWGYAITDASIRTHFDSTLPPPTGFPYPRSAI